MMAALATAGAVKALVPDSVFKRAQEIIASDKLLNVAFEGDTLSKGSANCVGSSPGDVYVLSVSIDGRSSRSATAVGQCSCPAGAKFGLCKHVIALLLRRAHEPLPRTSLQGQTLEEHRLPVASDVEKGIIATRGEVREAVTEAAPVLQTLRYSGDGETVQSTTSGPSNAKRVLPSWMLGVVGSAAQVGATKSKKRAAAPKPPRPPPPPTKRPRRYGKSLKISNGCGDEELEDPGEVEDAGPMGEASALAMVGECDIVESICRPNDYPLERQRRKLKPLKMEDPDTERGGCQEDEVFRRSTRRPRASAVTSTNKLVKDLPVRSTRRRRLVKKVVEEDSDISENETAAGREGEEGNDGGNCLDLTDDDLLLLAQEQVEKEKTAQPLVGSGWNAQAELPKGERGSERFSQEKKSSIFSMSKWKELSGGGAGPASSLTTDDLDLQILKEYSLGDNLHHNSCGPSLEVEDEGNRVFSSSQPSSQPPGDMSISLGTDETDAVANDMLNLIFGPSLSISNVPAASTTRSLPENDNCNAATHTGGLFAPAVDQSNMGRFTRTNLSVESKAKKKSSLKDKVKMFLS